MKLLDLNYRFVHSYGVVHHKWSIDGTFICSFNKLGFNYTYQAAHGQWCLPHVCWSSRRTQLSQLSANLNPSETISAHSLPRTAERQMVAISHGPMPSSPGVGASPEVSVTWRIIRVWTNVKWNMNNFWLKNYNFWWRYSRDDMKVDTCALSNPSFLFRWNERLTVKLDFIDLTPKKSEFPISKD